MLTRPARILSPPDIRDPDFRKLCAIWTDQMMSEMGETVAITRHTIAQSKLLLKEADRILRQRSQPNFDGTVKYRADYRDDEAPVAAE